MTLQHVVLLVLAIVLGQSYADTLVVAGGFSKVGGFDDTGVARYNGWYFDTDYHVQIQQGQIYAMCYSSGDTFVGGDFTAHTYGEGNVTYFMHTNSWFQTPPDQDPPVIVIPIAGYGNDYQVSSSMLWAPSNEADENLDGDDDGDDHGDFGDDDNGIDDDDDGGGTGGAGGDDDDEDGGDDGGGDDGGGGGDDIIQPTRRKQGRFRYGVYHDRNNFSPAPTPYNFTNSTNITTGGNVDGPVFDLFCLSNYVVVGGNFTTANGQAANNIAIWQTYNKRWVSMGGGTNGPVYAVAGYGRTLYAGGAFTELNGTSVTNLAAWDTVNATWTKFGVCINGVVMDIAIGKKGSAIYVGGNFVLCNSRNSALANFVEFNAQGVVVNGGMNGTVRQIFVARNGEVYVGGNFGTPGFDEVRSWGNGGWTQIGDIYFAGEVHAVVAHDKGGLAVGGTFTHVIVNGRSQEIANLALLLGTTVWAPAKDINGPVYAMLASVTTYPITYGFILAGLGVTGVGWIFVLLKWCGRARDHSWGDVDLARKKLLKASARNTKLAGGEPASHLPLFLPLFVFLIAACAIHAPLIAESTQILSGAFSSLGNFELLLDITRMWTAVIKIDLLVGFILSTPLVFLFVMVFSYANCYDSKNQDLVTSRKTKSPLFFSAYLITMDAWQAVLLVAYITHVSAANSLVITAVFVAVKEITSELLTRTVSLHKAGDISVLLGVSTSFHLISRLAIASLLAVSPSIPSSLSVFIPTFSFLVHLLRYHMNKALSSDEQGTYSKSITYEEEPGPPGFWKRLFFVRVSSVENEEYRILLLLRQFLERIVDFVFLLGYNPLTPFLLLIFTVYDYACVRSERIAPVIVREYIGILRLVLFMCFCAAPLSPGLFIGWRSLVSLSSLFASVLLTATCIGYFLVSRKYLSYTFGTVYGLLGIFGYSIAWTSGIGSWSAFVPLFGYSAVMICYVLLAIQVFVSARSSRRRW